MASSDPIMSSVDLWPLDWAPVNWAPCNGQLIQIKNNTALYSLLGTNFGGDGKTTFGLPDLRGRVPVGVGSQPGGTNYALGKTGGAETKVLTANELPLHTHIAEPATFKLSANTARGAVYTNDPTNRYAGIAPSGTNIYGPTADSLMGPNNITVTVANAGSSQAVSLVQPFQVLNYIIALYGYYPTRP